MTLFKAIQSLPLPQHDALDTRAVAPYFRDALQAKVERSELTPSQLQHAIFNHFPTWLNTLMSIRNRIVKVFGFNVDKTGMSSSKLELEVGDQAGFLTVIEKSDNEIISIADDKHMTFYLSVKKLGGSVVVSSLVNQKTLIGRVYVNAILPFHYFIARIVINNALKAKRM
jgi:hypothetical protein